MKQPRLLQDFQLLLLRHELDELFEGSDSRGGVGGKGEQDDEVGVSGHCEGRRGRGEGEEEGRRDYRESEREGGRVREEEEATNKRGR